MRPGPGDILGTYERQAQAFARARTGFPERHLYEAVLRRMRGRRVLDLGCGSGHPVASFLASRGARVTGIDGAAAMIALFRRNLPHQTARRIDMRHLRLRRRFDAIVAWDSFFHLPPRDQRAMFAVFRVHALPGGLLIFSSGGAQGTGAIGKVGSEPVWHASLSRSDYRRLLGLHGFAVLAHRSTDASAGGRTWWLARRVTGGSAAPRSRRPRPRRAAPG